MSAPPDQLPQGIARWLAEARRGSREALGRALEGCRQYLLVIAQRELPADVQGKVGPSDLVQEALLRAQQDFDRFDGNSESGLLAWLRQILVHQLANCTRQFATDMRDVGREVALDTDDSHEALANGAVTPEPSPSDMLAAQEEDAALARALARLPEHYRRVVELRNTERLSFQEIGRQLGVSAGAARKVWVRALQQLREMLKGRGV